MEGMDKFASEEDGYTPSVKIRNSEDMQIQISELGFSDLISIIDDPSDAQEKVLSDGWNKVKGETHISPGKLKNACDDVAENERVAEALHWRIDKALGNNIFHESKNVPLDEILQPGQCTVLQMDNMGLQNQQMLAAILLRKINQARVAYEKNNESEDQLDFPVFVLLEEGHRFAPADGHAQSLGVLGTILSEGRKFGIGVGIISQRPSKIDDDVLSQCKTQVIMQIQNPLDQDAVKKGVEDVGEDLLSELPGLTPGQAIIAGDSVNTPFLARIRERYTPHEAESLDATELWKQRWSQEERHSTAGVADADQDEGIADRDARL
jgi:DNA helicase HerA-like ATPase